MVRGTVYNDWEIPGSKQWNLPIGDLSSVHNPDSEPSVSYSFLSQIEYWKPQPTRDWILFKVGNLIAAS